MDLQGPLRLLVYLLIGALIIYVVYWILGRIDLDPGLRQIISIVLAVVVILWLIVTLIPGASL